MDIGEIRRTGIIEPLEEPFAVPADDPSTEPAGEPDAEPANASAETGP